MWNKKIKINYSYTHSRSISLFLIIIEGHICLFAAQLCVCLPPCCGPGMVAEQFLNSTATQLTYHGLCELTSTVQEGELCVFFRNNHFSTMIKYKVITNADQMLVLTYGFRSSQLSFVCRADRVTIT